jgi:hypothetical protein
LIESYDFGRIVVDGAEYTSDVIIKGSQVIANWRRREGHILQAADLKGLDEAMPDVLIIGTGYAGMMEVPRETRKYFVEKKVEFIVEKTKRACDLFNSLSKSRKTVAALHLTC